MEPAYLAELREEVLDYLIDRCEIWDAPSSGAASNNRGGMSETSGGATKGFVKILDDIPCRIQSTRMKISVGEMELGSKAVSKDEGILVLPYDTVISDKCKVVLTSGEEDGSEYEITQQMSQTEAFTRVFSVLRIR